jgi:hypothetical protein
MWTLSVVVAVGLGVEYREPLGLQHHNSTLIEGSNNSTYILTYLDARDRTNSSGSGKDPDFQAFVDRIWRLDEGDRASENDVVLDWGENVNGTSDMSERP